MRSIKPVIDTLVITFLTLTLLLSTIFGILGLIFTYALILLFLVTFTTRALTVVIHWMLGVIG